MKNGINVLLLIDSYLCNTGGTVAITTFLKQWREMNMGQAFVCARNIVGRIDNEIKDYIYQYNGNLRTLIEEKDIDIVDYYLATQSLTNKTLLPIARKTVNSFSKKIRIVTTVCQRPSNESTILTARDIKQSDHLVFIDNSAYNDCLYTFIPKNKKSRIYFGSTKENEDITGRLAEKKNKNRGCFIFGRGSTLNKCPKDILEVFDKINVPNKTYKIVGVSKKSWLASMARGRSDIEIIPPLSYNDWLEACSHFDVFLYYLPEDAHSSIDGTLGDAMLMKIPPIIFGPDAPKERIVHGKNGFVADTKEEIIYYAELLYRDENLRKAMGESARSTQIEMFSFRQTILEYKKLFEKLLLDTNSFTPIQVPIKNSVLIYKEKYLFSYFSLLYDAIRYKCRQRFIIG